ncbi:MAG: hypothetical protein N2596_05270, partial [Syntrophorhabdaceae bacterium]|nr:hypothetical protein [Syntrophorhabdaceae bacterium]
GIENIGGGWSYGLGRLGLKEACIKILDLSYEQDRIALWRFDDEALKDGESIQPEDIKQPEIEKPWTIITADASIAKGQLLAVSSSYPAFDEKESYPEYPDSFVYRGYVVDDLGQIKTEPIIPGRTIRQAILSTQIERKLRTINTDTICTSLAGVCNCDPCIAFRKKNKTGDSPDCKCLKCNWFGSGGKGGIIAVTDAVVQGAVSEVVHRIQLCEHSMQNINLFSEEYLTKGTFKIRLIIDESRNNSHTERLKKEVLWVLNDMREDGISPPGWYRIGATSTATGQVVIKGEPKVKHCGGIDD